MVNTNLVSIKINNIPLQVPAGTRILDACRDNGFHVPYLCYLKDINEIGACRVCVVEVKGIHHLVTSCNNQVQDGMEILTNSPRVREARKINVEGTREIIGFARQAKSCGRLDRFIHPRVESEIAFLLARDIEAPATTASVLAATDVVFGAVDPELLYAAAAR